jgi:ABC-2 type transport system permease protein
MGKLLAIARFELRTKLPRISTAVYFLVFGSLAALWMALTGGAFASSPVVIVGDKMYINSPFLISQLMTIIGLLAMVTVAAFMGRAVEQDFESQSYPFFFTSPISKYQYFVGRFLGAVALLMVIFLGIAVGAVLGAYWPGVEPSRVGPWSIAEFVRPYVFLLLPNVLFLGACFFGLAALGRRMMPVYVAGVVVLIGNLAARSLLQDIDNKTLAAMLDPIGSIATSVVTRYWSQADKNTQLIPFAGEVLMNRALWLGIGLAVFGFCYARFRMAYAAGGRDSAARPPGSAEDIGVSRPSVAGALPAATLDVRAGTYLRQLPGLAALYLRETVKNVYFIVIVLAGVLFLLANAKAAGTLYGTNTYRVTYQVLDYASGTFGLFMLIITAFYAGELVWRERDARMALIADSFPTPSWLPFAAKLGTLMAVQALLQLVVLVCGVLIQLGSGYTHLELGQYLFRLYALQLPEYWMIAALALTIHAVLNHKYLGHFLVVLFYIVQVSAAGFGFDHLLYLYGSAPQAMYSDMNGYGHFLGPVRWFQLYWAAAAVLLLVVARLFWVRGADTGWRTRVRIAGQRWTGPLTATAATAAVVFVATGAWIYYNTDILNHYRSEFAAGDLRAQYEKSYKPLASRPQPRITAARVDVDIFPHRHHIRFAGTYTLKNKGDAAIPELYVNVSEDAKVNKLAGSVPMKLAESRPELGWRRYTFDAPLAAGATMTVDFDLEYPPAGFTNAGAHGMVVDNGTFVNSFTALPIIGYEERKELTEDRERRKHGLQPKERMHDLDDAAARRNNYISHDADWIDFDTTVTTSADQIALAPGYLQREWTEGDRRHFHYKMDVPILNFYAYLSARYAVKRDVWHGGGKDVPIEIYYQPGHEYDLDRMIAGVKDGLDYYTKNFSPYQHHQVRILEFPRYARFAQSFPNTIPFSESIGFIAKVDPKDPKDIDYPYYVTAHEVAHQWWAHQVIGADVQGATMMSETLAQYSALMVMKHKYGDAKMKRFLHYELDAYLTGRSAERKKEQPLYRNENQGYIHYRKGSLAMYALQDYIGEENVNRALASYIRKVAFQDPPYTISRELLAEFRAVTPPEYQSLIGDLFETITLFENRAISATARDLGGGRYQVKVEVEAKKVRSDAEGMQTDVPMDDWIDIGVLGADDVPLYLKKHRLKSGRSTLTVEVTGQPARAGIDPVNKLIDKRPDDNTVKVEIASK